MVQRRGGLHCAWCGVEETALYMVQRRGGLHYAWCGVEETALCMVWCRGDCIVHGAA